MNFGISGLLHNVRIRTKLLALVLVPILGLGYLALARAIERGHQRGSAVQLKRNVRVSVAIGNLLHETQKERGMSSGYLSSHGQKFSKELGEQQLRMDSKLAELRTLMSSEGGSLPAAVRTRISDALNAFAELAQTRAGVKGFHLDVAEVISFYTGANSKLLDSLSALAAVTPDAELGRVAIGYTAFLGAKERTGIERASLTNVFTNTKFADEQQYQFVASQLAARNTLIDIFLATSKPEIVADYNETAAAPAFTQTASMESLAMNQGTTAVFAVDPKIWFDTITGKIDAMKKIEDEQAGFLLDSASAAASSAGAALFFAILLSLMLIAATIALALVIIRDITGPLEEMTSAATKIASGDVKQLVTYQANNELGTLAESFRAVARHHGELQANIMDLLTVVADASDGNLTVRAKVTTGSLGNVADAFNSLLEALSSLIGRVAEQIDQTNQTVTLVQNSSHKMASGATTQANEVHAAKALVEKTTEDIKRVGQAAKSAADAAKHTEDSATEGATAIENIIAGMEQLRQNVQAGAKKMKNLGDRSMEITGIVDTISRISEQTNMLALNAAIEAARAGEHGRGFSVVAEEVRKLAERTAVATQEISKLVTVIHQETNETVAAIEKQTQVVEQESALVAQAGQALLKIRSVSTESANLVSGITSLTKAQIEGTGVVGQAINQIQQIAQATLQGVEGTVSTLGQLTRLSSELTQSMRKFKVN
jgi:methyl-accepting chemotaxis protein